MNKLGTLKMIALYVRQLLRKEFIIFVVLLCLTGTTWISIELADEVTEGETKTFDQVILEGVRGVDPEGGPQGPQWLTQGMRDITALGGVTVLTIVTIVAALFLFLKKKYWVVILVLLATGGGYAFNRILKYLFARERPEESLGLVMVETFSFPSGHAMMSAIVYFSLAALLARIQAETTIRIYIICVAFFLTLSVGWSRIYLGVHYPTDVLAGWSIGIAWGCLWWLVGWSLQHMGTIESYDGERDQ